MNIADYLGKHASSMLHQVPFKQWRYEKSFEGELDEPIIHYVFPERGLELRCDGDDRISVVFVFLNEFDRAYEDLFDIAFASTRRQVLTQFGKPSKSGSAATHPILGDYGPWDRFALEGHAVRFEYSTETDMIRKITLMREDAVPPSA